MIIRAIEKPFDIILEARVMLDKRIKTLLIFFGLNMFCLSVNFLEHANKPHLWFCGELEKALNVKVDKDEWEEIEKLNQKNVIYFNVENTFFVFLCMSYFMVFVRIVLSIIDNHGVLK